MTGKRWAAVTLCVLALGTAVYFAPVVLGGPLAGVLALAFLPAPVAFLARWLWQSGEEVKA